MKIKISHRGNRNGEGGGIMMDTLVAFFILSIFSIHVMGNILLANTSSRKQYEHVMSSIDKANQFHELFISFLKE